MELNTLIAECTANGLKVMLEEKKPMSWLKRVSSDASNVGDHDGDVSETILPVRQQKTLNLIKEFPTITGRQMLEILLVSQRTIERDLSALQKRSVLKHEGKDNDGIWIIDIQLNENVKCFSYKRNP